MDYGFDRLEFYVVGSYPDTLALTRPCWCVSSMEYFTLTELLERAPTILGQGKLKWYWRFLPWRDVVAKYHKPRSN